MSFDESTNKDKYLESNINNDLADLPINLFTVEKEVQSSLENVRIIQKNLVYIVSLPKRFLENEELLTSYEYLGQYGKVEKLVLNKTKCNNENSNYSSNYSCYATFSKQEDSALAILALEGAEIDGQILKASYGTTKYCTNFLKNSVCLNNECIYLHHYEDPINILSRNEMKNNKMLFERQLFMAIEESRILMPDKKLFIEKNKNRRTIFPNPYTIYKKGLVMSYLGKKMHLYKKRFQNRKPKIYINILYKYKKQSRFDFVSEDKSLDKYKIQIPSELTYFISKNFQIIANSNNQKGINFRLIDNNWSYLLEYLRVTFQKELPNLDKKKKEENVEEGNSTSLY